MGATLRLACEAIRWRQILDEIVVIDLRDAQCVTVNACGTALWPLLVEGTTRDELASALVDWFHIPDDRALSDVDAFVRALAESDLLAEART